MKQFLLSNVCTALPVAALIALPDVVLAKGKPGGGGGNGDIAVDITFDATHTTTGETNRITADRNPYSDSNSIQAFVGRNFGFWLYLQNSGRVLNIDLSRPLGCADSVAVDNLTDVVENNDVMIVSSTPDGVSDYCYHDPANPSPLRPQPPSGVLSVDAERFEIAAGRDLDDLEVGCVIETDARLRFRDSTGNEWRLVWGPRQIPGWTVPNPRSCPLRLTRVNQALIGGQLVDGNFWFFETTGTHLAALHRQPNPQSGFLEYYGQFTVPFSGYAVAQTYDPDLIGNHCTVDIPNIGSGLLPSDVTLAHDPVANTLTATAIDQSDDFSSAPNSFDWYADGQAVATGIGNSLDLTPFPDANVITVFALHPDWLAKLPNLLTIARGEVEGSTSFIQGSGVGSVATVDSLAWSFPRGGKDIQVVITVTDAVSGDPLAGIDVAATLDGPGGISIPIDATTDSTGQVSAHERNAANGEWCVTIVDVHDPAGAFTWDAVPPSPNCTPKT